MVDAYVHATVEPGAITDAAATIADSPVVAAVHLVTGHHDLEIQIAIDDKEDLARAVTEEIHTVTGVRGTETHVAFEP